MDRCPQIPAANRMPETAPDCRSEKVRQRSCHRFCINPPPSRNAPNRSPDKPFPQWYQPALQSRLCPFVPPPEQRFSPKHQMPRIRPEASPPSAPSFLYTCLGGLPFPADRRIFPAKPWGTGKTAAPRLSILLSKSGSATSYLCKTEKCRGLAALQGQRPTCPDLSCSPPTFPLKRGQRKEAARHRRKAAAEAPETHRQPHRRRSPPALRQEAEKTQMPSAAKMRRSGGFAGTQALPERPLPEAGAKAFPLWRESQPSHAPAEAPRPSAPDS